MSTEYQVVRSDVLSELEQQVNEQIRAGWSLQGGVAISTWFESVENLRKGYTDSSSVSEYAQAMTREN